MSRPGLHDISWRMLRRAETHHSHHTVEMLVGVDRPPIFMWVCPWKRCGNTTHTYARSDATPTCAGGYPWSYTTRESNDR